MANTRELRRRIKSVKSTAQITKAMQMVAATKMRKAQSQALNGRPYSFNLGYALGKLLPLVATTSHPLLRSNDAKISGVLLLTTDKSLCGALNTNLFRLITSSDLLSFGTNFYTVGKKGRNFIARTGGNLIADFENSDVIAFRQATILTKLLMESFLKGEISSAFAIYPHFGSTLRQEAKQIKLLPIEYSELEQAAEEGANNSEFIFEPDTAGLLDYILVHFLEMKIYQSLLETKASEHSARMMAMQNATDNALELVTDLNLTYNQTRQNSITCELLEITTAAAAMGG